MFDESTIEWNDQSEFPGEINGTSSFSIDVLVYSEAVDEHTVGFYDYKVMTWRFLCNETIKTFKWRYFQDEIDKYKIKKSYNEQTKIIKKSTTKGN